MVQFETAGSVSAVHIYHFSIPSRYNLNTNSSYYPSSRICIFNSITVQFKAGRRNFSNLPRQISIPLRCNLNVHARISQILRIRISIPLRCDSKRAVSRLKKLSAPDFNSITVQLRLIVRNIKAGGVGIFQFHYGAIRTREPQPGVNSHRHNSIPLRCD